MTRQQDKWHPLKHPKVSEGKYEITTSGQVRNAATGYVLTNSVGRWGYTQVCLTVATGKTLSIKTHRLVAETFLPNPNRHKCINHKDEVKTNNQLSNLEWCDYRYNNLYSKSKWYESLKNKGVNGNARFDDVDFTDWSRFFNAGISQHDIARAYSTSNTYVCTRIKYAEKLTTKGGDTR